MSEDQLRGDLNREVWCLLGLIFDATSLDSARSLIYRAVSSGRQCFISTPNLNFTVAALGNTSFRETVTHSDLSLIDGMPLLWVARLLGTGLKHKSSGSDLFHQLWQCPAPADAKLKVFFFGGAEGVAERACESLNKSQGGLSCAGFLNPGFGSIDELSDQAIVDRINVSNADFLVVALGANKGQLWIERNRERLGVPVVSHLGAVVNFVAGTVRRAPVWMQRSGLEWLWRIFEEPSLWRRYFSDGIHFGFLFVSRVLPYAWWRKSHSGILSDGQIVSADIDENQDGVLIAIHGSCLHDTIAPLRSEFAETAMKGKDVTLDLAGVPAIDGAFLGLCLILKKHLNKAGRELSFTGMSRDLNRIFRWNCVEYLL